MGAKRTGEKPEPTLELPSLRPSFRRKKRTSSADPEDPSASAAEAAAPSEPEQGGPPPPAEPAVAETEVTDPVNGEPVDAEPVNGEPVAAEPVDIEPVDADPAAAAAQPTAPAADDLAAARPGMTAPPATEATAPTAPAVAGADVPRTSGNPRRERSGPALPALTAVVLTGLLVGVVGAGATAGGLQGCEAARGTASCGDPGFFVLVAIVIVMMLLGAVLLKALQVTEAKGVSFLGVGLLCVIVLVGPVDALFSPWMFVVVPALTALTFAVGRWVTTRFVDPTEDEPGYDVR
jgi:hypothetical protein